MKSISKTPVCQCLLVILQIITILGAWVLIVLGHYYILPEWMFDWTNNDKLKYLVNKQFDICLLYTLIEIVVGAILIHVVAAMVEQFKKSYDMVQTDINNYNLYQVVIDEKKM